MTTVVNDVQFESISIDNLTTTVIDNTFTNVMDGEVMSGTLITDVRDHLPVFTVIIIVVQRHYHREKN